jgi:hypothetical protein
MSVTIIIQHLKEQSYLYLEIIKHKTKMKKNIKFFGAEKFL